MQHARLIAVGEAAAFGKSRIRWLSACIFLFCNSYARGAKSYGRGAHSCRRICPCCMLVLLTHSGVFAAHSFVFAVCWLIFAVKTGDEFRDYDSTGLSSETTTSSTGLKSADKAGEHFVYSSRNGILFSCSASTRVTPEACFPAFQAV
jgi:hypothetical protein